MDTEGVTTGAAAALLGVRESLIQSAVRNGIVSSPPLRGGRRRWSAAAIEELRTALLERGTMQVAEHATAEDA